MITLCQWWMKHTIWFFSTNCRITESSKRSSLKKTQLRDLLSNNQKIRKLITSYIAIQFSSKKKNTLLQEYENGFIQKKSNLSLLLLLPTNWWIIDRNQVIFKQSSSTRSYKNVFHLFQKKTWQCGSSIAKKWIW